MKVEEATVYLLVERNGGMTAEQLASAINRWLSRIIGDDPEKKVHLMMSYTGSGRDVADPWYSGDSSRLFRTYSQGARQC